MSAKPRSLEVAIDIAASAEQVWRALVDQLELVRWFSLTAEVKPGLGGHTKWAWDDGWTWVSTIDQWEPGRRLGLINHDQRPFDADGHPMPAGQAAPATLGMVFTLETRAGTTRLTLVHSGFGRGTSWDDEFDGVSVGWKYEFTSLKHYLENHQGRDRRGRLGRLTTRLSQEQAWQRILGPGGFDLTPWPVAGGDRCRLEAGPDRLHGRVNLAISNRDFSMVVDELGGGIVRLGTHQASGATGVSLWVASHRADREVVTDLSRRLQDRLTALFTE